MATNYLVKNISAIVNDSVEDALGKTNGAQKITTTDFASLGKAIDDFGLYDGFFGSLCRRIAKTVAFVRAYNGSTRHILRDEHEYGAFVEKVYVTMPDAVDSATWSSPTWSGSTPSYSQASPYDVESTVTVTSLIYGGAGSWSIEIIRPMRQIRDAFLSESAMAAFIDAIYLQIENTMKFEEERIVAAAVNTAMAADVAEGGNNARNLLGEYNTNHPSATLTVAQALESADFIRYATMEIRRAIANMGKMSTAFNVNGYNTFTDKENMVVEMLSHFAAASEAYLQSDTYHKELVSLPMYEEVPFWHTSGNSFSFTDCSKIDIENSAITVGTGESATHRVQQGGIICFVHDIENVAAYFGNRRTWEMVNPRSEVVIHGEKCEKGFAVDNNANSVVFYMAVVEEEEEE